MCLVMWPIHACVCGCTPTAMQGFVEQRHLRYGFGWIFWCWQYSTARVCALHHAACWYNLTQCTHTSKYILHRGMVWCAVVNS